MLVEYIGRKPYGQKNLRHPKTFKHYAFYYGKPLEVDDQWGIELLKAVDEKNRQIFINKDALAERQRQQKRETVPAKTVKCRYGCTEVLSNQGLLRAHYRKAHPKPTLDQSERDKS